MSLTHHKDTTSFIPLGRRIIEPGETPGQILPIAVFGFTRQTFHVLFLHQALIDRLLVNTAMHSTMRSSVLRRASGALRASRPFRCTQQLVFARLLGSLAILEQRGGKLQGSSLSSVTAAQKLGGSITGIVAGSSIKLVAEEASKVKGIDKIIMVENGAYDKVCLYRHIPRLSDS